MTKKKLSAVIICKNEEAVIKECLTSIAWMDEIILLDAGSTDNTLAIAKTFNVKIYSDTDWQGFGIQRQRAQSFASGDLIFMIDADERVTPELRAAIEQIITKDELNTVYRCKRKNFFLNKFIHHCGWSPDYVIRLYPNYLHYYDSAVHESLNYEQAKIVTLNGDLLHLTCRDFFNFQQKQSHYAQEWARQRFDPNKKYSFLSALTHSCGAFFKTWILKAGFLDGYHGFLLAKINAQYTFNKYVGLWALAQQHQYKM